jgi:TctA family transporter
MKENPEKENPKRKIPRRDLLRLTIAGSGAVAVGALLPGPAPAQSVDMKDKRRARYQADSAEVRDFYRVNSYPGAR